MATKAKGPVNAWRPKPRVKRPKRHHKPRGNKTCITGKTPR
jgi:hypothetical protein